MSLIPRTWPYGTIKTIKVILVERKGGIKGWVIARARGIDEPAEAYVLVWNGQEVRDAGGVGAGQTRKIEFTKGGPTGGYWKLVPFKPRCPRI